MMIYACFLCRHELCTNADELLLKLGCIGAFCIVCIHNRELNLTYITRIAILGSLGQQLHKQSLSGYQFGCGNSHRLIHGDLAIFKAQSDPLNSSR
jgi:hypothetical protein